MKVEWPNVIHIFLQNLFMNPVAYMFFRKQKIRVCVSFWKPGVILAYFSYLSSTQWNKFASLNLQNKSMIQTFLRIWKIFNSNKKTAENNKREKVVSQVSFSVHKLTKVSIKNLRGCDMNHYSVFSINE